MTRIIIADDHAIVRQGLRRIVEDDSEITVAGEAATAREVLSLLAEQTCDVLVLDINLPDNNGLDLLQTIRKERPQLPVLVLSVFPEDQYALRALRMGAAGYINKTTAPEELLTAIRKVCHSGKYISQSLAEKLAFELDPRTQRLLHESLSDREFQVLRLLAAGRSVSEIAAELSLSVTTISTYRARILEKMGFRNNAELTRYALEHRLIE
ncbi:MAG TPA: response regulator transcription factor [Blastocatellia bacterium]|nr:response regulator transcription factor [Blastocatellia bacterium]